VYKTVDAGMNWTDMGIRSCIVQLAMDPQKPDTVYAVTEWDGTLKTTDGGTSWNKISSGVLALAVDSQNPQILYTSMGATVYKSLDGGMSWNPTTLFVDRKTITSITIDPQNSSVIYAVSSYPGGLWKSVDGGTSWQDLSAALPYRITL